MSDPYVYDQGGMFDFLRERVFDDTENIDRRIKCASLYLRECKHWKIPDDSPTDVDGILNQLLGNKSAANGN